MEQLRTHTKRLNSLHPAEQNKGKQMVQLYEKGYGKDAAGIAMEAINYARWVIDMLLVPLCLVAATIASMYSIILFYA